MIQVYLGLIKQLNFINEELCLLNTVSCNITSTHIYLFLYYKMQKQPNDSVTNSILNVRAKIQQFLVFYHNFYKKEDPITFDYDSRFQNLNVQGSGQFIAEFRIYYRHMLQQYKASSFSLGFKASSMMNFLVGTLARMPTIKCYDSQILQSLNSEPNIHLEFQKNRTYMIGPKQDIDKLVSDLIKWIAAIGLIGIKIATTDFSNKKSSSKLNIKQATSTLKNISDLKKEVNNLNQPVTNQKDNKIKNQKVSSVKQQNKEEKAEKALKLVKEQPFSAQKSLTVPSSKTESLNFYSKVSSIKQKNSVISSNNSLPSIETDVKKSKQFIELVPKKTEENDYNNNSKSSVAIGMKKDINQHLVLSSMISLADLQNNRMKRLKILKQSISQCLSYYDYTKLITPKSQGYQTAISIMIGQDIMGSQAACQFIVVKSLEILKFNLPQFHYKSWEIKQRSIILRGNVPDKSYENSVQNQINKLFQYYQICYIELGNINPQFFVKIKDVKQLRYFLSNDQSRIFFMFSKNVTPQKMASLNSEINNLVMQYSQNARQVLNSKQNLAVYTIPTNQQMFEPPTGLMNLLRSQNDNQNNSSQISSPKMPVKQVQPASQISRIGQQGSKNFSNKIVKKLFRFNYMIGQDIWKYVQELSDTYLQINANFNAISKFQAKDNYIRIFQQNSFTAKGPQNLLQKYKQLVEIKINELNNEKLVMAFQISEQTHKRIVQQNIKLKKLEQKSGYRVKIISNPQIAPIFQIKQIRDKKDRKLQINGIKASQCDLFIDNFGTILIFDRIIDHKRYREGYKTLDSLINDNFYSILSICQQKNNERLVKCIQESISDYYKNLNKSKKSQQLKVFIFAQLYTLKELIWNIVESINNIEALNLQVYIVFKDEDEPQLEAKGIPNKYKRWYVLMGDQKYYSEQGNTAINKAQQAGQEQFYLNSDHVLYNRSTHILNLKNQTMKSLKSDDKVMRYRDCKDWIQFDLQGQTHRLAQCRFKQFRQAEKNKQQQVQLSISLFLINIKQKIQINVWNGYQRKMQFKQVSLDQHNLMISNECLKYMIQLLGSNKADLEQMKQEIQKLFCKRYSEQLKLKNLTNPLKIDTLYRLCKSNNIAIKQFRSNLLVIDYQLGNIGVEAVKKYVDMINNEQFALEYPQFWKHAAVQTQHCLQFNVDAKTEEFATVAKNFPYKIIDLKRIQNSNAYSRYFYQKKFLQKLNNNKKIKQLALYHGTSGLNPSVITADKQLTFNINYSTDKNYMGRATYFAERAEYSNNYRFKVNATTGVMLLCLVLVGDSQKCPKLKVNYLDTGFKDEGNKIRYESMTDFYDGSQIYTVYKNNRAYPIYRIQYQVK